MKKALIIGGNGFLGRHLAHTLYQQGTTVRVLDLTPQPNAPFECFTGDIRDLSVVTTACQECDTVFNTASLVDWGPRSRERLFSINVQGNRNVIQAAVQTGVKRLIYTSSIDVVFDGTPLTNGDETLPYPARHLDDYGRTKMLAEKDIIQANGQHGLLTCSLRTAGIYGPGDAHRFPQVFEAVRKKQWLHMGDGSARFGHVYVANVVEAHRLAAEALTSASPPAGQCYFIGDHAPCNFYTFFDPYLQALAYPITRKRLPYRPAYLLAAMSERLSKWKLGPSRPKLTRYVVASTCVDFFFSYAKAQKDLGYQPIVSEVQAFAETCQWLKTVGYGNS